MVYFTLLNVFHIELSIIIQKATKMFNKINIERLYARFEKCRMYISMFEGNTRSCFKEICCHNNYAPMIKGKYVNIY